MNELLLTLAGLVTIIAIAFSVYNSHKNKKVLDHIEKMLADAIKGKFHEGQFSEDRESRIESKLADYLQSSVLSAERSAGG